MSIPQCRKRFWDPNRPYDAYQLGVIQAYVLMIFGGLVVSAPFLSFAAFMALPPEGQTVLFTPTVGGGIVGAGGMWILLRLRRQRTPADDQMPRSDETLLVIMGAVVTGTAIFVLGAMLTVSFSEHMVPPVVKGFLGGTVVSVAVILMRFFRHRWYIQEWLPLHGGTPTEDYVKPRQVRQRAPVDAQEPDTARSEKKPADEEDEYRTDVDEWLKKMRF